MKILYFDTETTGLDPRVNEITQFAAIVEIDGEIKEEVNWRCQPTRWEHINEGAIATTGVSIDQLKTFDSPAYMAGNLKALFNRYIDKYNPADKFYPAGHNVLFDLEFLQAFWNQHIDNYGTGSYQNWRALDSRVLANFMLASGRIDTPDVKLETLCSQFSIQIEAHDAMSDIRATRELIRIMLGLFKEEQHGQLMKQEYVQDSFMPRVEGGQL